MTSPLITNYLTELRRSLPAPVADEAADGLIETYQRQLATATSDRQAAHAALADFGDLPTVLGEYTRQAPGRHFARLLLATGPVAAGCWAAALVTNRAWTWLLPTAGRLSFGAILLVAVLTLLFVATSRHSYQRTRLALIAGPVILALDATAVIAALTAAPGLTSILLVAMAFSLGRIAYIASTLRRLAAR